MSDAFPTIAAPDRRVPQRFDRPRAARAERSRHRQNAAGDLVIPLERGEVVTLPRLWGFVLATLTESRAVLSRPDGLRAEITLLDDAAEVQHVEQTTARRLPGAIA